MLQPTLLIPHGGSPLFLHRLERARYLRVAERFPRTTAARSPRAAKGAAGDLGPLGGTGIHLPAPPRAWTAVRLPQLSDRYLAPHLTWPAPWAPLLAERAAGLFEDASIATAFDGQSGLDPDAPLAAGAVLAPLGDEEVLIIDSGNSFHNLQVMMAGMFGRSQGVAGLEFDAWQKAATTDSDPQARHRQLAAWDSAPGARHAQPREEHLVPLHVVAGAAAGEPECKTIEDHVMGAVGERL